MKQQQKLEEMLKKGFATVYEQCLQDVKEKLESTKDWEATLKNQSLHNLIQKIKRIRVGFDDHKQEVLTCYRPSGSCSSTPSPRKRW